MTADTPKPLVVQLITYDDSIKLRKGDQLHLSDFAEHIVVFRRHAMIGRLPVLSMAIDDWAAFVDDASRPTVRLEPLTLLACGCRELRGWRVKWCPACLDDADTIPDGDLCPHGAPLDRACDLCIDDDVRAIDEDRRLIQDSQTQRAFR